MTYPSPQPLGMPLPPKAHLIPTLRHPSHTRSISALTPLHTYTSFPPFSAGAKCLTNQSPRPVLRVITSFPPPPARRPRTNPATLPLGQATELRQPVPVRHRALEPLRTAPLPAGSSDPQINPHRSLSHRKPIPALHVHIAHENDTAPVCPPSRPDAPIRSSLEKRRNREAVIISTAMYTSYHPGQDWGEAPRAGLPAAEDINVQEEGIGTPSGIIPPSSRPSARGHKRTLSDKFKSLFSPPVRTPRIQLTSPVEVAGTFERVPIYDDSDVPTYSATYPQPDDPFSLAVPLTLGLEVGQGHPEMPYRSPGTASFTVNRERHIWTGGQGGVQEWGSQAMDENAARRNTFGVIILEHMSDQAGSDGPAVVRPGPSTAGGGSKGSPSGGNEADDEMSEGTDHEGELADACFGDMAVWAET